MKLFMLLFLIVSANARDNGQYSQVDPTVREWFRSQKVPAGPNKGNLCCNEADGAYAEEDIIQGHYWTRWRIQGALTAWQPVPDETVIPKGNRNGAPVVWWGEGPDKKLFIRCFSPGALT